MADTIKHTPGPWVYDPNDRDDLIIKDGRGHMVAEVTDNRKFTLKECQLNAQLIAAAPELLAACLVAYFKLTSSGDCNCKGTAQKLSHAIEKATK